MVNSFCSRCISGERAAKSRDKGIALIDDVFGINEEVNQAREAGELDDPAVVSRLLNKVDKNLVSINNNVFRVRKTWTGNPYPYTVSQEMTKILKELQEVLRTCSRVSSRSSLEEELSVAAKAQEEKTFLAAVLGDAGKGFRKVAKLTKPFGKVKPTLVLMQSPEAIFARTEVPPSHVTDSFNASLWAGAFAKCIGAEAKTPKGQDPKLVCNVNAKKETKGQDESGKIEDAFQEGKRFASMHLE